jgi:anti-sigma B factor antagonist
MIVRVTDLELLDDPSGVRIIVLTGEQDLSSAGQLRLALAGAHEAGRAIVIELSMTSFIDSTILGVIVGALRDCTSDGRGFALVAAADDEGMVPRLLGFVGLLAVFPTYASRSEAVEQAAAGRNRPAGHDSLP